ncbi:MAG: tRNA adenosine(34) deaminase TadA [Clostridia bacterium]|nr:tRNA adenosine(34) deaminase TadA [Clostridia bacterium]
MTEDETFMSLALDEARAAAAEGETPVGAVIVRGGEVIASAHNTRERSKNALHHAEILCIDRACRRLGGWRLPGCALYVTLEPCPMCAGAVINSRIERVVFGARDGKAGSFGSVTDLSALPYNHRPEITGGVLAEECAALLSDFFTGLRSKQK